MGIALKVGEPIPLAALLTTRETTKFVRAIVRDADGVEIAGSPFNVPHLANGFYFYDLVLMPNTPSITVEYDAFEDAGFTSPSFIDPSGERFDLDEFGSQLDKLREDLIPAGIIQEIIVEQPNVIDVMVNQEETQICLDVFVDGEVMVDVVKEETAIVVLKDQCVDVLILCD